MDMNFSFDNQVNIVSNNNIIIKHQYTKNIHISQNSNMNVFASPHLKSRNVKILHYNKQINQNRNLNHGWTLNPLNNIYTDFGSSSSDVNNARRVFDYGHQNADNIDFSCDNFIDIMKVDHTGDDDESKGNVFSNNSENSQQVEDLSLMHYKVVIDKSDCQGRISLHNWSKLETTITPILDKLLKKFPESGIQVIGWQAGLKIVHFKNLHSMDLYYKAIDEAGELWENCTIALMPLSYLEFGNTVGLLLPKFPDRPQDILEVLEASNPNLAVKKWSVRSMQKAVGESRLVWLNLPKGDIEAILKAGDYVQFGFATIKIIFNKKNSKQNDQLDVTIYKKHNSGIHQRLGVRPAFSRAEARRLKKHQALAMKKIINAAVAKRKFKAKMRANKKSNQGPEIKSIKQEILSEPTTVDIKPIKQELELASGRATNRTIKNSDNDGQSNKENSTATGNNKVRKSILTPKANKNVASKKISIKVEKNVTSVKDATKANLNSVQTTNNITQPKKNK